MGMKKVLAKQQELRDRETSLREILEVIEGLAKQVQEIDEAGRKYQKLMEDMFQNRGKLLPKVEKIKTHDVKEFEHYKTHLKSICEGTTFSARTLPTAPLKKVVDELRKESSNLLNEWIKKHEATMPKELKKGMTFHDYSLNRIYECTSDEKKSTNINLKGDEARYADTTYTDLATGKQGGGYPMSYAALSPKAKVKFLKM